MTAEQLKDRFKEVGKEKKDFLKWAAQIGYKPTHGEVDRHLSGERKISRWAALAYCAYFLTTKKSETPDIEIGSLVKSYNPNINNYSICEVIEIMPNDMIKIKYPYNGVYGNWGVVHKSSIILNY